MRAGRVGLLATLVALGFVATALASEKDLKEARAAFSKAVQEGSDKDILAAATRLARAEPPRGALALVELGLKGERRAALGAQEALGAISDVRIARSLASELSELRDSRARRLLCGALASVPGEEVNRSLAHALSDTEALVRVAAARAVGARDSALAPLVSASLRDLVRRDPSPRVRQAANTSLARLGLPTLPGFDVEELPGGLPSRFFASRVAFVIDASATAQEALYEPPPADLATSSVSSAAGNAPKKPPVPGPPREPTSAYAISATWVSRSLQHLADDQAFQLLTFRGSTRMFDGRYLNATARETAQAIEWLKTPPGAIDADRDPVRALGEVLAGPAVPDEVYVFLCGLPEGRESESATAASELAERAWEKGVIVHVTLFEGRPKVEGEESQRDQVERARLVKERRDFASRLGGVTGGRFTTFALEPFVAPAQPSPAPSGKPVRASAGSESAGSQATGTAVVVSGVAAAGVIKLVNGRVPYGELLGLRHALDVALRGEKSATGVAPEVLARQLAACPDESVIDLAIKALFQGSLSVQHAVLDGLATNREPRVHTQIAQALKLQTADPLKAFLLARALAAMPGTDVAQSLALEAEAREGSGDLPRLLLRSLAARPAEELAAITSSVRRGTWHERRGLAGAWARNALEIASGKAVAPPALPGDAFLPEHWAPGGGVAIVVDAQDGDLDRLFVRETEPAHGKDDPHATKTHDWSRRDVILRETHRALTALAVAHASANCILLGESGRAWDEHVQLLTRARADEATDFLRGQLHAVDREVAAPLENALNDPGVEEVWVLALGLPVRSDVDKDVDAVRERIATLSFRRGVPVFVVLPLGAVDPSGDAALAAADRRDEFQRLERFWGPMAAATGGHLFVRDTVALPQAPPPVVAPGSKPGKAEIAPVASPSAPAHPPAPPVAKGNAPVPTPAPVPPPVDPGTPGFFGPPASAPAAPAPNPGVPAPLTPAGPAPPLDPNPAPPVPGATEPTPAPTASPAPRGAASPQPSPTAPPAPAATPSPAGPAPSSGSGAPPDGRPAPSSPSPTPESTAPVGSNGKR